MWKNAVVMISRAFESMTDYTYWNLMCDFYFISFITTDSYCNCNRHFFYRGETIDSLCVILRKSIKYFKLDYARGSTVECLPWNLMLCLEITQALIWFSSYSTLSQR